MLGRPPETLSPAQRRRLQRAVAGVERASERERVVIEDLIAEGAAQSAIARELGLSRQALNDRLRRGPRN